MRSARRAVGFLAIAAGGVLLAGALATPAKAWLGQRLIAAAWDEAQARGAGFGPVKPWPWADAAPIARLSFPSLGEERLVLDQASGEAMAWGPGHVRGSSALGSPGLSAIAAHRDTHFALLADLAPGDVIALETRDGAVARYRMVSGHIVDARTWRFPVIDDSVEMLALSTCFPFDAVELGPERYIVFAERLPETG